MMLKIFAFWITFINYGLVSSLKYKDFKVKLGVLFPEEGSMIELTVTPDMGLHKIKVISPINSLIDARCDIAVEIGHKFIISRSGETDLRKDGVVFRESAILPPILSIGNEIVVAGSPFTCIFTAIKPNNTNCDCDWKKTQKIFGGSYTSAASEFIAHVGITQVNLYSPSLMLCGGSIITQKHVITAAHCLSNFKTVIHLNILAGYRDYTKPHNRDTPWSAKYKVEGWTNHPDYDPHNYENDIAIVFAVNYIRFT